MKVFVAGASGAIGRPLVFASVDPDVAEARGVPVRALRMTLLLILAVSVAVTWVGLAIAYYSDLPVGFLVTTLALGAYAAARTARLLVPA